MEPPVSRRISTHLWFFRSPVGETKPLEIKGLKQGSHSTLEGGALIVLTKLTPLGSSGSLGWLMLSFQSKTVCRFVTDPMHSPHWSCMPPVITIWLEFLERNKAWGWFILSAKHPLMGQCKLIGQHCSLAQGGHFLYIWINHHLFRLTVFKFLQKSKFTEWF